MTSPRLLECMLGVAGYHDLRSTTDPREHQLHQAFDHELRHRFPALRERVIFLTGDALSRDKRGFLERTGAPFLTKPFDLAEVRRLVHRMLAGEAVRAGQTR